MRSESAEQLEGVLIVMLMARLGLRTVTIDLNEVEDVVESLGTDDIALRYEINKARNSCTFTIDAEEEA